jgi:hypothetical protein
VFPKNTLVGGFGFQNLSDTDMFLSYDGTDPTTTVGIKVSPGQVFTETIPPFDAVRVICSAAGKPFYAWGGIDFGG